MLEHTALTLISFGAIGDLTLEVSFDFVRRPPSFLLLLIGKLSKFVLKLFFRSRLNFDIFTSSFASLLNN